MKTSRSALGFLLAASLAVASAQVAPAPRDDRATELKKQMLSGLKYDPQLTAAAEKAKAAEPKPGDPAKPVTPDDIAKLADPDNPDVLVLPKMTVKQKPRPRLTPDMIATDKGLADLHAQKTTDLDRVLNKFTIPLFGVSAAERARQELEAKKKREMADEVSAISKVLDAAQPQEADALRAAAAKP